MTDPIALEPGVLAPLGATRIKMASALASSLDTACRAAVPTAPPVTSSRADGSVAPPDWASYIGQASAKAELRVRIHSANVRQSRMPHTLLTGGAGVGKTTLARLIAAELGLPIIELTRPCTNEHLIDRLWDFTGLLFIDEIHLWGARASNGGQHALMQMLEAGTIDSRGQTIQLPPMTFVAGTTNPERLFGPLRDRFSCRPRLVPYTDDEMTTMVAAMAGRLGVPLDPGTCTALGVAAASRPRTARLFAETALDLFMGQLPADAATVLALTSIDPDGLGPDHRNYLTALAAAPNGTAGLTTLATITDLPTGEIRNIERLLSKRNLIAFGSNGRRITTAGRRRALAAAA